MTKICDFVINRHIYTIYDVDKIDGKESYVGSSHYEDGIICIEIRKFQSNATYLKARAYARLVI